MLRVVIHLLHIEIHRTVAAPVQADEDAAPEPGWIGFSAHIERDYRDSTADARA